MGKRQPLTVDVINQRLKAAGVPIAVRQVGQALYLRSSKLPPKPGDATARRYQIAQGPVGEANLLRVESEAHRIWRDVLSDRFNWADYGAKAGTGTVGHWVSLFRAHHLQHTDCSPETFEKHWAKPVYSRLPQDAPLTPEVLLAAVLRTADNTRHRKHTCQKLTRLAEFAGVAIDLRPYQGSYGRGSVQRRELPTDEQIEQWYGQIPNPLWQRIYARAVAFGLRPSEAFSLRLIDTYTAEVIDAKSKARRITKAFPPHWAEQWQMDGPIPKHTPGATAESLSGRFSTQMRRYGITACDRYDFRHAWCVRVSVIYKIPVEVAARWAGHSAEVHQAIYTRWIRDDQAEQVYQRILDA